MTAKRGKADKMGMCSAFARKFKIYALTVFCDYDIITMYIWATCAPRHVRVGFGTADPPVRAQFLKISALTALLSPCGVTWSPHV